MLPFGATIPPHLLRCSGLKGCLYGFAPHALHLGQTCRVNYPG